MTGLPYSKAQHLSYTVKKDGITVRWDQKMVLTGGYSVPGTKVDTRLFQTKNTIIFSLETVADSQWQVSYDTLGLFFKQLPGYRTGTAFYRYGPIFAWTVPLQAKRLDSLKPDNIQFFIWQYGNGLFAAAMPMGGNGYSATLGRERHAFGARSVSLAEGAPLQKWPVLAIAFGKDPYRMVDDLYATALEFMGEKKNLRRYKQYPSALENIGWCTWNAIGFADTEEKIIRGVSSFTKNNFPLRFLLIDDGWLNITGPNGRLKNFVPDPEKFPNGFRPLVDTLRRKYRLINIGVWHTLNGYWGGIDTAGESGRKYRETLMPYRDKVSWSDHPVETFYAPTIASGAGFRFYDDWYRYLEGQGITFVKVDDQLIIDRMAKGNKPLWDAGRRAESNLQSAVQRHFKGAVINCMEMTADVLYHLGSSAVARASEDFLPGNTTYNLFGGNAAVHILSAFSNSMWLSEMVWPDFDMFQSHPKDGEYHAIARAISGGPVYLTDTPGLQHFEIMRSLVYKDGRIIRADVPARPTKDCLFQGQDPRPFKAFSVSNHAGLLAAFNVTDTDEVKGYFSASDIYGLRSDKWAVYDHFDHTVRIVSSSTRIPIDLQRMGYKLFLLVPLKNNTAVFGLINKYNAPKTIISQSLKDQKLTVILPEGGRMGAYIPQRPKSIRLDGKVMPAMQYTWKKGLLEISIPSTAGNGRRQVEIEY